VEAGLPVAAVDAGDAHAAFPARRMDEAVVAKIDADMGKRVTAGVEEHEVARLEVIDRNTVAHLRLLARAARQRHAGDLLEYVADESAAIHPAFRRLSSELVADADQVERRIGDVLRPLADLARRGL